MTKTIVTLLLAWAGGAWASAEDDPVIDDKPLSQWVKQLRNENRGLQLKAAQALSKAPAELHVKIVPLVIPVLKSERENDKFVAAQILGNYGPPARVAASDLLPMLQGTQYERNRAAAAKALGQILKDAQPSEEVDKVTAALTAKFNEEYDPYSDVRRESVRALGMIGPAAMKCIPKLTRALTDFKLYSREHQMVRQQAAWTCGRMGPLAAEHVDRLISMMHAEGHQIPEIAGALGRIGAINDNVVANIVDKMESSYGAAEFRMAAMNALLNFGPKAVKAKDFLVRVVKGGCNYALEYRLMAIKILGAMGPAAKDAVPVLEKAGTYKTGWPGYYIPPKDYIEQLNKEAAAAIARIGGEDGAGEKPDEKGK